jgi:hypothetical protein
VAARERKTWWSVACSSGPLLCSDCRFPVIPLA